MHYYRLSFIGPYYENQIKFWYISHQETIAEFIILRMNYLRGGPSPMCSLEGANIPSQTLEQPTPLYFISKFRQ